MLLSGLKIILRSKIASSECSAPSIFAVRTHESWQKFPSSCLKAIWVVIYGFWVSLKMRSDLRFGAINLASPLWVEVEAWEIKQTFYSYLVSIWGAHRKIVSCTTLCRRGATRAPAQVHSKYWRRKQTPVAPPGSPRSFKSPSGILSEWEKIRTLIRFQSGAYKSALAESPNENSCSSLSLSHLFLRPASLTKFSYNIL